MKEITEKEWKAELMRLQTQERLRTSPWTSQELEILKEAKRLNLSNKAIHSKWEYLTGKKRSLESIGKRRSKI